MRQILDIKRCFGSAILLCSLTVFASSCMTDELLEVGADSQQKGKIALNLSIPGATEVVSRSAATTSELTIKSGYLLVFENANSFCSNFAEITEESIVDGKETNTPKLLLTLNKVDHTPGSNDIVVLVLNASPLNGSNLTMNASEILSIKYSYIRDVFRLSTDDGFVSLTNGLPMYGTSKISELNNSSMTVTRAVAKIVVAISDNLEVTTPSRAVDNTPNFNPQNVTYQIFHNAITGHIDPPNSYGSSPNTATYSTNNKAPNFNLVDGTSINKKVTSWASTGTIGSDPEASYIYPFPHATRIINVEGIVTTVPSNTYKTGRLVILLKVKNEQSSRAQTSNSYSYYKLSLLKNDNKILYIDILKNRNYTIVINKINDKGYDTAQEALREPPSNIDFGVISTYFGYTTVSNEAYAITIGEQKYAGKKIPTQTSLTIAAVGYLRASNLTIDGSKDGTIYADLPPGATNKITVTAAPEIPDLTPSISELTYKSSFTASGVNLTLTKIPYGYAGKIDYKIELGELTYDSKTEGTTIELYNPIILMDYARHLVDYDGGGDINGTNYTGKDKRGSFTRRFKYENTIDILSIEVGSDKWITNIEHDQSNKYIDITYQPHNNNPAQMFKADGLIYTLIYDNGYITNELMNKLKTDGSDGLVFPFISKGDEDDGRNDWAPNGFHIARAGWHNWANITDNEEAAKGIDPFTDNTQAKDRVGGGRDAKLKGQGTNDVAIYDQDNSSTHNIISLKFNTGKENTAFMVQRHKNTSNSSEAFRHPAAFYCNETGSDYYIPSVSEWKWIRGLNLQPYLGNSYDFFTTNEFRTSTEGGPSHWASITSITPKDRILLTRCIKDMPQSSKGSR